ncbi:ammonium transporter [Salinibaculum salinum]|uniref:ammonium transporter n=1 Tax=Salinibaculum salinum TaxID=3131996 RepID=UPI003A96D35E
MIDPIPLQVTAETFAENINALGASINYMWILTVSFLIFFMHAGFAMLEAGQVRSKNVANQLTKNLLTWSVGVTVFFLIGAGVSSLVGGGGFNFVPVDDPASWGNGWFYGAVFAMTAATIVSGAVAGRAKLRAYVTYTFLLAAVIYPVVTGITWAGGYIQFGDAVFYDFAGGTIVHAMGGVAGLTAAYVLGPRIGRFNDDGSVNVIPGHSMTFAVLGTLLLAFGWYGFNVGTASILSVSAVTVEDGAITGGIAFNGAVLGRVVMTTTVSMAMGAIGAALVAWAKTGKVDTLYVANGLLAGLVGITAIPDAATWWGALLIGLLAGAQLPLVFELTEKLGIDDVCAVFPVHGSAGVLGTLAFPFVAADLGPSVANAFLAQVVGVAAILGWTVVATGLIWYVLKATGQARVTPEHEQEGLDVSEHGVETYPEFGGSDSVVADGGPTFKTDGGSDITEGDNE